MSDSAWRGLLGFDRQHPKPIQDRGRLGLAGRHVTLGERVQCLRAPEDGIPVILLQISRAGDQQDRKLTTLRKEAGQAQTQLVNRIKHVLRRHNLQWELHSGEHYQGINVLLLWAAAEVAGHVSPFWLTFRQAKELGAFVRKAEKGSPVVYASTFKKNRTVMVSLLI